MANIIAGLLAISLGLWGLSVWWGSVTELLRGLAPPFLLALGFIALAAGVSTMRNDAATKLTDDAAPNAADDDILDPGEE